MKSSNILAVLSLCSVIFSCQNQAEERQQGEVVFSETFNMDELPDSPESDEDFLEKYGEFIHNTIDLYAIDDDLLESHSTLTTESNGLYQKADSGFEFTTDDFEYFSSNSLIRFHDLNDIEKGWEIGEEAFWSGALSNDLEEGNFKEFKNSEIHAMGDYSEYSELPLDDDVMVILHIKWRKLIIYYSQNLEPEMIDEYIEKIRSNFDEIKDAYNSIDQTKIDELIDRAMEDVENVPYQNE